MKRPIFLLSLITLTLSAAAQHPVASSYTDLPAVQFSTKRLQSNDPANVEAWMKKTALQVSRHTDSLLKNYSFTDPYLVASLKRMLALSYYINGDWHDLQYADTVYRSMPEDFDFYKRIGMVELAAYAKAKLDPGTDFPSAYVAEFKKIIQPLSEDDKERCITGILKQFNDAQQQFETQMANVRSVPVIAYNDLPELLRAYVYRQINPQTREKLLARLTADIKDKFRRADTLRGSITPERAWWKVLRYDISVTPDYATKSIAGANKISYRVTGDSVTKFLQLDLQEPMKIDSILEGGRPLSFSRDGNVWHVAVPRQPKASVHTVIIYYHGTPREAVNPPWDGGWIWKRDSLDRPWMSVACQGLGASVWYPCKDVQSDEPDSGVSLNITVPDSLVGVANGRLQTKINNNDGTTTYRWVVVSPINNYDIVPYIGKYVNYSEIYDGEKGKLDVNYWVLDYNLEKAKEHMVPEVHRMLQAHEYWMGPYPFYEDGYKIVDAPHLGMEHQGAIAYGNKYMNGYLGDDLSATGWGLKWDYIIVHESGHEWFGNNITTDDIADMWVHEGFTNYSESLFIEHYYGKQAGIDYTIGLRNNIQNILPVIGYYGVNDDVSIRNADMYPKGANLLQTLRSSINNDSLFRSILRGLNRAFYHQTVTSLQVEKYISEHAQFDYSRVFDQYLRNSTIPLLEISFRADGKQVSFRYTDCIKGFDLPLLLKKGYDNLKIFPTTEWTNVDITDNQKGFFDPKPIEESYYIRVKQVPGK